MEELSSCAGFLFFFFFPTMTHVRDATSGSRVLKKSPEYEVMCVESDTSLLVLIVRTYLLHVSTHVHHSKFTCINYQNDDRMLS